jgi:hypothetical protein
MLRHVKELILALQCGLLPPSEVIGDYGYDIAKNLADIAGLQAKAAELGIAVPFGKDSNQNVGL